MIGYEGFRTGHIFGPGALSQRNPKGAVQSGRQSYSVAFVPSTSRDLGLGGKID